MDWDPVAMAARDLAWSPSAGRPGLDPGQLGNASCTVVATNVLAFDGPVRNDEDRGIIRKAMLDMTHAALQDVGDCLFEDRGDGMLIVVPDVVPTLTIMQHLTEALPHSLRRHNRLYNVCAQIQMRIAVDTGLVEGRDRGITGLALSRALRLLDAPVLSRTLSTSRANLGMIVSSSVYDSAIRPQPGPRKYGQVWVGGKEDSQQAWMHMIDPAPERLAVRA